MIECITMLYKAVITIMNKVSLVIEKEIIIKNKKRMKGKNNHEVVVCGSGLSIQCNVCTPPSIQCQTKCHW
jgi:hypothetical protein